MTPGLLVNKAITESLLEELFPDRPQEAGAFRPP